jgi:hypothetical protein
MGILESLIGEPEAPGPSSVKLVTIPDGSTQPLDEERIRLFDTVQAATDYAKRLPPGEREASFIRTDDAVQTLEEAESTSKPAGIASTL